jgi:hypothetical protein
MSPAPQRWAAGRMKERFHDQSSVFGFQFSGLKTDD